MTHPIRETITREEFDKRIDESNARLRQELAEAQERVQQLETLIARKAVFAQRLEQVLAEIECEEDAIAALEKGLRSPRAATRRPAPTFQVPQ